MDRADLQQRLLDIEAKISSGLHQITEQRQIIAELERGGSSTHHAKYLLAGLELLQAAHRDRRSRLLKELGKIVD
jgi:hypothetical protein